jgi:hypothetical protein
MNYKIHNAKYAKVIISILIVALGSIFFGSDKLLAEKNQDIFSEILNETSANVQECSITTSFESETGDAELCKIVLKNLGFSDGNLKLTQNKNIYCIDFSQNNYYGYIESMHYENEYVIAININDKCSKNELSVLKTNVDKALKGISIENKYFLYIKSKIPNQSINIVDSKIKTILRKDQAIDVNSVNLNNGITTTAYTGLFSSIKSGDALMDFNYAVCRYSSGNYLIMGSPEIIVTY